MLRFIPPRLRGPRSWSCSPPAVKRGLLALLAGASLAPAAHAQIIASDAYNYNPPGNILEAYLAGGIGFVGTWYEQFGHWTVESGSLSYSDGTHSLATSGHRVRTSNAEARRNLTLPGGPLGNTPGTIWVSMLAQQTGGVAANSFGGLSLPTGLGTFIYMGKPYNRAHWGIDGGPGTTIRESNVLATEPALLVMRIDYHEGADDIYLWVNPPLGIAPSTATADVTALQYNNFQNTNILLLQAGATNSSITMDVDEIRLGTSFFDVAPSSLAGDGLATPNEVEADEPTLLTVRVAPAANPASSGISVIADLSSLGGSPAQPLFDDGTNGDAVAGDNVYSTLFVAPPLPDDLDASLPFSVSDAQGRTASGAIALSFLSSSVWYEIFHGDAGDSLSNAQMITGNGSRLRRIRGTLGSDDADLYQFYLCDPRNFSATTVGGASFDTQLFLFNPQGVGVSANDDSSSTLQSTLTNTFTSTLAPGFYYLGVSQYDKDPLDSSSAAIWSDTPFTSELAPIAAPANRTPLSGWTSQASAGGSYRITLTGACRKPAPPTCLTLPDCPTRKEYVFQGGITSNTATGSPYCTSSRAFNAAGANACFGHTFLGLPANISAAVLEINVTADANGGSLTCNDTIGLGTGAASAWSRYLGASSSGCSHAAGLHSGVWTAGTNRTFCLDLASLPNASGGPTNLLPLLNSAGLLHIGLQDDTRVHWARLWVETCDPCTRPPDCMKLWAPLDDAASSPTAANVAPGGIAGNYFGGPIFIPGAYVANSRFFNGSTSFVQFPQQVPLNPGTGDFTIDAWIRLDQHSMIFGAGTIVSKYSNAAGYDWRIAPGNIPTLALVDTSVAAVSTGNPIPNDGQWHHVAVSACRTDLGSRAVQFYLDGLPAGAALNAAAGSLNSTAPFLIGSVSPAPLNVFHGYIDEVEFFCCCVPPYDIRRVANASHHGKCKTAIDVPWDVALCGNASSATAQVCITNTTGAPATYLLSASASSVSSMCSGPAPTGFSFPEGTTITVPPGLHCFPVVVDRPPGISVGQMSCFSVTATNLADGCSVRDEGSIWYRNRICGGVGTGNTGGIALRVGEGALARVSLQNLLPIAPTLTVQAWAVPSDMRPGIAAVGIDGLNPGERATRAVAFPPNGDIDLDYFFFLFNHCGEFLMPVDILIGVDMDANGVVADDEVITSFIATELPSAESPCPADVDDGSGTGTPDGGVTIDDLLYYLNIFEAGDLRADVDDGSGTGTRDGGVTIDDLLYFLQRFEAGC